MSRLDSLHAAIVSRLSARLGPPSRVVGRDAHWSFRPASGPAITILLCGGGEPVVWVFDPGDHGVACTRITAEADLEPLLANIRLRTGAPSARARR